MFDDIGVEYVKNSFRVYKPNHLYNHNKIQKWEKNNKFHKLKGYSDHLPIIADFRVSNNISSNNTKKISKTSKEKNIVSINKLYEIDSLSKRVSIKNAVVIYQNMDNAIIKQPNSKAIYLYGCASNLQEGYIYDIDVESITNYQGLKEIKSISNIIKKSFLSQYKKLYIDASNIDIKSYINNPKHQNEIITNLRGIYNKSKIVIDNIDDKTQIKLYFKDKNLYIENNSNIVILKGQISTYKGNIQIVIHNKNDIISTKEIK
jgi:hypothetical protein